MPDRAAGPLTFVTADDAAVCDAVTGVCSPVAGQAGETESRAEDGDLDLDTPRGIG